MIRIFRLCLVLISIVIMMLCFSCKEEDGSVKIGVVGPFSGDIASYGELVKNAALLAQEEINYNGGINGTPLKLIFEDSQCDPKQSVSSVRKLISIDKVNVILGDTCSSATYAAGTIAQQEQIVLLTPISSADNISDIGSYVFRLAPYDSLQAGTIGEWIWQLGYKEAAILHINNDYGKGLSNSFQSVYRRLGGKIVKVEAFDKGTTDLRSNWDNIKRSGAKVVFAPAYPIEAILILTQKKEKDIKIQLVGTDPYHDARVVNTVGDAANNVLFTDVADGEGKEWEKFKNAYVHKYGIEPNIVAAESYDSVKIIAYVMIQYGLSSENIRNGLNKISNYYGASGLIEFDENGDCVTKSFHKYTIENGKYKKLKE